MITGAPIISTFVFTVVTIVIWIILDRYVYRERLEVRDGLLKFYEGVIKAYRKKLGLLPMPASRRKEKLDYIILDALDTGFCFSIEELSAHSGISPEDVRSGLNRLRTKRLVESDNTGDRWKRTDFF